MEIVLNRRAGVSVRDQLVAQIEMMILGGALKPGQRLPSVRALARRLELHPNTISAAYQDLQHVGRVENQHGSGVFVRQEGCRTVEEAEHLDDMIRLALALAQRRGFSGREIRAAVERWLSAAPPERLMVVDRCPQMAELLACELSEALAVRPGWCALDDVAADPGRIERALVAALPFHTASIRRLAPRADVRLLTLEMAAADRQVLLDLPAGAIVTIISRAPTVLPLAARLVSSLRGHELLPQTATLDDGDGWERAVQAADLVFADVACAEAVRAAGERRLRVMRLITREAVEELRPAAAAVAARGTPSDAP